MLFKHQVTEFSEDVLNSLTRNKCPKFASSIIHSIEENLLMTVNNKKSKHNVLISASMLKNQLPEKNDLLEELQSVYFVCKICLQYIRKDMLPPKSILNCLESVPVPEEASLRSYLEEALISRVLLFIKIFSLKTSLMPVMYCHSCRN